MPPNTAKACAVTAHLPPHVRVVGRAVPREHGHGIHRPLGRVPGDRNRGEVSDDVVPRGRRGAVGYARHVQDCLEDAAHEGSRPHWVAALRGRHCAAFVPRAVVGVPVLVATWGSGDWGADEAALPERGDAGEKGPRAALHPSHVERRRVVLVHVRDRCVRSVREDSPICGYAPATELEACGGQRTVKETAAGWRWRSLQLTKGSQVDAQVDASRAAEGSTLGLRAACGEGLHAASKGCNKPRPPA